MKGNGRSLGKLESSMKTVFAELQELHFKSEELTKMIHKIENKSTKMDGDIALLELSVNNIIEARKSNKNHFFSFLSAFFLFLIVEAISLFLKT